MKELKEVRFDHNNITLGDNRVMGPILPKERSELDRDILIEGDTIVEGAVYAHRLEIRKGNTTINGSVMASLEVHINSDYKDAATFKSPVASPGSVVSHSRDSRLIFASDINAREVRLNGAFVGGSIYADEITLENCVVVGGVFAISQLSVKDCLVGTFNAPSVTLEGDVKLLLPSVFALEPLRYNPATTRITNLTLVDLGALYRRAPESPNTGSIDMDIAACEVRSSLSGDGRQLNLRCYSIVGKVLAADMIEWQNMQNHILLTASAMSGQLLRQYDLGLDADGNKADITIDRLRDFFFGILRGQITPTKLG